MAKDDLPGLLDAPAEPCGTLTAGVLAEMKRRRNFLRRIAAGKQPAKPPHRSYFRLGLLVETNGHYALTAKAIELYIASDPLTSFAPPSKPHC